jgi:flagellin-like hook-associated protein FlgL
MYTPMGPKGEECAVSANISKDKKRTDASSKAVVMASSITINSNLAALNTQRRLNQSTQSVQQSYTRLSSGLRINKASDDAAGLAIASGLTTDRRVFQQGVRNLNDGISALNIADGAVESLSNIVIRLEELAEQSANGTLGNKQRQAVDKEAQALSKEYTRISSTARFNGQRLLDGSMGDLRLQGGYGETGGLIGGFGGAIGTGSVGAASSFTTGVGPYFVNVGDLNGDGALDMVTADYTNAKASVMLGNGDGSFRARTSFTVGLDPQSVALGDLNGDGVLDIVIADRTSSQASVLLGNGDGSFRARASVTTGLHVASVTLGDLNGDGVLDIAAADTDDDRASVLLGNGDGSFRARASFTTGSQPNSVALGDLNGDSVLDIVTGDITTDGVSVLLGNGNGSFRACASFATGVDPYGTVLGDLNGDGALDIVTADFNSGQTSVLLGNGNGSFRARISVTTGSGPFWVTLGDLNGDSALDMVTADSGDHEASVMLGNGDGSFRARASFASGIQPTGVILGDLNGDGVPDIVTSDMGSDRASVFLSITHDGTAPLLPFDLSTMAGARQALPVFQRKLDQLSAQRAEIGAFQSRAGIAVNNLQVASENFAAAASQITDADVAEESAQLVKNQILQQAGAAVLAQANQAPALALVLLKQ